MPHSATIEDARPFTSTADATTGAARIRDIDVIRGAALFGVVAMNLLGTTAAFMPAPVGASLPTAPIDRVVSFGSEWLLGGKAQCLFGTLFGLGFALFTERVRRRRPDGAVLYARRLGVLLLAGLLQMVLLWYGDILHDYACVGFLLLGTGFIPDRVLLASALVLLVGSISLTEGVVWAIGRHAHPHGPAATLHHDFWHALSAGDYPQMVRLCIERAVHMYDGPGFFMIEGMILGQFLFGCWIFRQGWLQAPAMHRGLFRRAALILLPAGLIATLVAPSGGSFSLSHPSVASMARHAATLGATAILAYGYAATLLVLCGRFGSARPLVALGALGRMALTNYVGQSVFFFWVIDGFGLGLIRTAGASLDLLMAVGLTVGQAVASTWWLRRFRFGPLEWLWRSATYGAWQPFRATPEGTP